MAEREQKFLYPPPEYTEKFTFGFQESIADSFWLRWIQDADYCQSYLQPIEKLDPALQPQNAFLSPRYKNCDNSWAFKMLDTVTKLAPKFKMPYLAGAITLSVLTEDYAGATKIFERGLEEYPDDWGLAYRAAYHYLFDLQQYDRAAELMLQAEKNGAPQWLRLLAARLYSDSGRMELGISVLENYRSSLSPSDVDAIKSVDKRIADLRDKMRQSPK